MFVCLEYYICFICCMFTLLGNTCLWKTFIYNFCSVNKIFISWRNLFFSNEFATSEDIRLGEMDFSSQMMFWVFLVRNVLILTLFRSCFLANFLKKSDGVYKITIMYMKQIWSFPFLSPSTLEFWFYLKKKNYYYLLSFKKFYDDIASDLKRSNMRVPQHKYFLVSQVFEVPLIWDTFKRYSDCNNLWRTWK